MNEKRKGEIAWILLKIKLRQSDVRLSPDIRRELGNIAKQTGIHIDEILEFTEIITRELVDEMFAKPVRK